MPLRMRVHEREPIGLALRRFKKLMERGGLYYELRRKRAHIQQTQLRRRKKFAKRFKAREATLHDKIRGLQPCDSLEEARKRFWKRTGKR